MNELPPGRYQGKDGHYYQVLSDGTTYREVYRNNGKRMIGPTLIRVGTTRLKAASPPVVDTVGVKSVVDSRPDVAPAAGGAA